MISYGSPNGAPCTCIFPTPTTLALLILVPSAVAQPQDAVPPPPMPFNTLTFNKTVAEILVTIVVVFFICGFVSICMRRCWERGIMRSSLNLADTVVVVDDGVGSDRRQRGLEAAIIDTFPTFVYSEVKGLKVGRATLECAVCLNEFLDDETLRLIPKCSHVFHASCVDAWLVNHSNCPVCRANLVPGSPIAVEILEPDEVEPVYGHDHNNAQTDDEGERNRGNLDEENHLVRSLSIGFAKLLSRPHSTGHSPVRPGMNYERFTLRLPEEVREQLVNSIKLSRTKSLGATAVLQRESSGRSGYKTRSEGRFVQYERFGRVSRSSDRWGFTCTPPFLGRPGSKDANKPSTAMNEVEVGERSTDRLFFMD